MRSTYPLIPIGNLVNSVDRCNPWQLERNELLTYLDISSVNRETKQVEDASKILAHEAPSRARQIVETGDVLVSTVRPNLNAVAHLDSRFNRAIASTGFAVLRAKAEKLNPRYLYYWVMTPYFVQDMVRKSTGASYPAVSDTIVKDYTIPLPSIDEQRRIANILDRADAIRRKRQEAIRLTEELLRSAFLEMFGDPVTNPKGWRIIELEQVCRRITDGTHQPPEWAVEGVPFLFVSNVVDGELDFNVSKYITEESWSSLNTRCPIEVNDILYTTVGSYGNAALVRTKKRFSFQRHIAHLKPNQEKIHPEFLLGLMQSKGIKQQADRQVRGVAQKTLNLRELREFKISVPPREEQERYVDVRRRLENCLKQQCNSFDSQSDLFSSLLQRAFRGEL